MDNLYAFPSGEKTTAAEELKKHPSLKCSECEKTTQYMYGKIERLNGVFATSGWFCEEHQHLR